MEYVVETLGPIGNMDIPFKNMELWMTHAFLKMSVAMAMAVRLL